MTATSVLGKADRWAVAGSPAALFVVLLPPVFLVTSHHTWLLTALLVGAVVCLAMASRWTRVLIVPPAAISILQLGYFLYSKQEIDKFFWMTLQSTETEEAISFFGALTPLQFAILAAYFVVCCYLIVCLFRRRNIGHALEKVVIALVCVTGVYLHAARRAHDGLVSASARNYVAASYYGHVLSSVSAAHDFRIAQAPMRAALSPQGPLAEQVLVVIGESESRLRMGVYGYDRNTTPLVGKNAIVFKNNVAVGLNTQPNVLTLLTGMLQTPPSGVDQDIFRIAKTAGYRSVVIDNNSFVNSDPVVKISMEADNYISMNGIGRTSNMDDDKIRHDQVIMKPFLQQLSQNDDQKILYVLHLMGSHPLQNLRYPKAFDKFPSYYDNSVLYTNYVLSEVRHAFMAHAKGPAVMIYFSDHGVRLPPGCGMGSKVPDPEDVSYGADDRYFSNYAIPLIVWTNDKFDADHARVLANLQGNTSKPVDQIFLLDSVSQLMGVASVNGRSVLDKSIFAKRSNFEPRMTVFGKNIDQMFLDGKVCVAKPIASGWSAGEPVGTAKE